MGRPYQNHYLNEEQKKIVEDNMHFLWFYYGKHISSRHKLNPCEQDDIIEALHWGICMAAEAYNPDKGKFSTICQWHFKSAVNEYFRQENLFRGRYFLTPFITDENISEEAGMTEDFCTVQSTRTIYNDRVSWESIEEFLDNVHLTSVEKQIVAFYWHFGFSKQEIGNMLGYTKENIRLMANVALEKVREYANANDYKFSDFISYDKMDGAA